MKINLKFVRKQEPVQTGLQVHTHMLVGWCSCAEVSHEVWNCVDDKSNGKMVSGQSELSSWAGDYCPKGPISECERKCTRTFLPQEQIPFCLARCPGKV